MSDGHTPSPGPNALRAQAASWFAHMRGPDAERDRAAFEAWLAEGPDRLAAYNRAAEIYAMGKILADEHDSGEEIAKPATRDRLARAILLVATCLAAIILAGYHFAATPRQRAPQHLSADAASHGQRENRSDLGTRNGEVRLFRLADGSALTLDGDSHARIDFDGAERRIILTRGRARFDVAHEDRPFLVHAGNGVVTAHGTVFDVQLGDQGQVKVHLLRGRVEVASRSAAGVGGADLARTVMLRPKEAVTYADAMPVRRQDQPAAADNWAAVAQSFNDVPLSTVVALVNRSSPTWITFADPSIGDIRVSGRLVINDPVALADHVAKLAGLVVESGPDQSIILRRPARPAGKIILPATP